MTQKFKKETRRGDAGLTQEMQAFHTPTAGLISVPKITAPTTPHLTRTQTHCRQFHLHTLNANHTRTHAHPQIHGRSCKELVSPVTATSSRNDSFSDAAESLKASLTKNTRTHAHKTTRLYRRASTHMVLMHQAHILKHLIHQSRSECQRCPSPTERQCLLRAQDEVRVP